MLFFDTVRNLVTTFFKPSRHTSELEKHIQDLTKVVLQLDTYAKCDAIILEQQKALFSRLSTLLDEMQSQIIKIKKLQANILEKIIHSEIASDTELAKLKQNIKCVMQDICLIEKGGLLAINQQVNALKTQTEQLDFTAKKFECVTKQIDDATTLFQETTRKILRQGVSK